MQTNIYLLIAGFIICCNNYDSTTASPMHGVNVRFAEPGEFPFVVSIKRFNDTNPQPETDHVCTGVLISNKDVLTAETCLDSFTIYFPEIIIGSNNIREGIRHYVHWWITARQWSYRRNTIFEEEDNTLVIYRLLRFVTLDILPVSIVGVPHPILRSFTGNCIGFGREIRDHVSNLMETVRLSTMTNRLCERKVEESGTTIDVTRNLFCAVADPVALLSKGNRGAPLVEGRRLIGIFRELFPREPEGYQPYKINLFIFASYYKDYLLDIKAN